MFAFQYHSRFQTVLNSKIQDTQLTSLPIARNNRRVPAHFHIHVVKLFDCTNQLLATRSSSTKAVQFKLFQATIVITSTLILQLRIPNISEERPEWGIVWPKEVYKSNFRQYGQIKSRDEKSQRREEKKKANQKRESLRRKKVQVCEKVGKSRNTAFVQ